MKKRMGLLICAGLALLPVMAGAGTKPTQWRVAESQNVLVIDTEKGRFYVELHPEIAPKAVERIKLLARRGTYDGLLFHRVIAHFVAQTGDPGNHDGGKTELPNLKPEFTFRLTKDIPHTVFAHPQGLSEGFIGAMPYQSVAETAEPKRADGSLYAWGSYCPAVMGMGRDEPLDSANSEIFVMLDAYPGLDRNYTPVGRIILGQDVALRLSVGEPPEHPDSMTKVQILADMTHAPKIEVLDTQGTEFRKLVNKARKARGADFSICDVEVPARVASR